MPQMAEKTSADAPPSCAVVSKFFGGLCALAAGSVVAPIWRDKV